MTIRFIIPGKIKDEYIKKGIDEFSKRLTKYTKTEIISVEQEKITDVNVKNIEKALDVEAKSILSLIKKDTFVILVDVHGENIDTKKFSSIIDNAIKTYCKIDFIFGSSYGISDSIRKIANVSISLSDLTFTHYMSLLLTMEQVYRSFKILNHETYDK